MNDNVKNTKETKKDQKEEQRQKEAFLSFAGEEFTFWRAVKYAATGALLAGAGTLVVRGMVKGVVGAINYFGGKKGKDQIQFNL